MRMSRQGSTRDTVLDWLALLYIASIPFDAFSVTAGRTLTGPLAILLIAVWVVSNLRRPRTIHFPMLAAAILLLYSAWLICTVFWSSDPNLSTRALQTFILQFAVVLVLSNTLERVLLRGLITLGLSSATLAAILLMTPGDPLRGGRGSIGGVDENVTALVLVGGFAALISAAISLGDRRALLLVPPVILTGVATLHTGSRSGAVAVVAVLGVSLFSLAWRKHIRPSVVIQTLAVWLLAYFSYKMALGANRVPERVVNLLDFRAGAGYGDDGRSAIIDQYLRTFDHWAAFGVGLGADASYLQIAESVYHNAHSLFWKTWIETGLVGLLLLGAFLCVVTWRGFRSIAPQSLLLLSIPIVVFAITLGGATTSLFWFVVALALTPGHDSRSPLDDAARRATLRGRRTLELTAK